MLFTSDPQRIGNYLSDESAAFNAPPEKVTGVYFPETAEDIVEVIKKANEAKIPVTISGGGTGITGSRVPMSGGRVISMEKFRSPIDVDTGKQYATLPPGISLSEVDSTLPSSLIYPPDPTEKSAFLGGTVATNATGARCFYYGPTRNWIGALRIVLANGDVLNVRRGECIAENRTLKFESESGKKYSIQIPNYVVPDLKNAAGVYARKGMDLIDLFIGSEGIFGVFTEITARLENCVDIISDIAFFRDMNDSLAYVKEARKLKSRGLLSLEFFDENSLSFMRDEHPEINDDMKAAVFVELKKDEEVLSSISELQEIHSACEDWCAMTSADARDLKELRHTLPDGINTYLKQHESYKLGTDFVVPAEGFGEMLKYYLAAGQTFKNEHQRGGIHYLLFGHIGDFHLHFNFITHNSEEQKTAKAIYLDLAQKAISLGGTISGEHGVGKKTLPSDGKEIPYLQFMYGEAGLREIARVKKAFDPNGILNVGNVVPMEYL